MTHPKLALLLIASSMIWGCNNESERLPPTISSLNRTIATPGQLVEIRGTNFATRPSEDLVSFNGAKAYVITGDPNLIQTMVPSGATTGPIVITVYGLSVTGPVFTIYVPGTITEISPFCGPIGAKVTISGTGFDPDPTDIMVYFPYAGNRDINAPLIAASSTQLAVMVPVGAVSGELIIGAYGANLIRNGPSLGFTITPFSVFGFFPTSGPEGATITITGSNFDTTPENNKVFFAGSTVAASVLSATTTQLTVEIPIGAKTGPMSMQVDDSSLALFNTDFTLTF